MTATVPKPITGTDFDELLMSAHRRTLKATPAEMASFFQDLLGQALTAYMTDTANPKAVGLWARGERAPRRAAESTLRDAYHAATLIAEYDDLETARVWFVGMNPFLHDRSPVSVFHGDPKAGEKVMNAAMSYLAYG